MINDLELFPKSRKEEARPQGKRIFLANFGTLLPAVPSNGIQGEHSPKAETLKAGRSWILPTIVPKQQANDGPSLNGRPFFLLPLPIRSSAFRGLNSLPSY